MTIAATTPRRCRDCAACVTRIPGQRAPVRCPSCRVKHDRQRHNAWKRQQRGCPPVMPPPPVPEAAPVEAPPTPYHGPELELVVPDTYLQDELIAALNRKGGW